MRLACTLFALVLLPGAVFAHSLKQDQRVPAVGVEDKGELIYQQDDFRYQRWNSAQLAGKVRVIQHIAGRSSAKEKNAAVIEAIKAAAFPHDRYQTTTIVNTDDAIPGTGMFVRSSIESNKKQYPWSQFIVDSKGNVKHAWQLADAGSAIVVLDKSGRVRFVKDGALTQEEVMQVISLVRTLLKS
ncbi:MULTISPECIES: YtfJ family protein [Pantoea]|uniref:YtfJ family protein n=1 Tax=Pantoea TaxID=53335 RepID=UPI000660CDEC|nr:MULTISPECIES: YtfJ family protein [Pantoea]MBS6437550.1 YtfJ family protein [Pantoea sp.]MDU2731206.1 YtfJ family protein [Pantoea sp.]HAB72864.1 YtfJ family protein [Pantoea sp.]